MYFGELLFMESQKAKAAGIAKWYTDVVEEAALTLCAHLDMMFPDDDADDVQIEFDENKPHFRISVRLAAYDTVHGLPHWICAMDYLTRFSILSEQEMFVFVFTV